MIRRVSTEEITNHIKEMCIEANHYLSEDMEKALVSAAAREQSPVGKKILGQLQENLDIAGKEAFRWHRGGQGCYFNGSKICRDKCMPDNGRGRRDWRYF